MSTARATALGAALLLFACGVGGGLSGCGLKGSLYLPQQKKTKVPETVTNPAADAPPTAPASAPGPAESTAPDDTTPAPTPTPTVPTPANSSPTGPAPRA